MNRFFNMDNKFFVFMGRVADLIILNLLCILCCLPVITAGASITALYYVTMKMVRNEESYIVKSFFKSFRQNFRQATIIHMILLVTAFMLYFDINIVKNIEGSLSQILTCIFIALSFLYALILLYIYPLQAKFFNSVKNTFSNALLMSVRHLPYTFLMFAVCLVPIAIFFVPNIQIQSTLFMLLFLMGISGIAFCNSKFLVKIFDNYVPKEDEILPGSGEQDS